MKQKGEQQFEDMVFPGIRYYSEQRTARGMVPKEIPEGHRRLWRSSEGNPYGMWADKPLTGYGTEMAWMDVPHEVAEAHRAGESSKRPHYAWYDRREGLPGRVNKVQFHTDKPHEASDWAEYRERWPD